MDLYADAKKIMDGAIASVLPHPGVQRFCRDFHENAYVVAIGKAAWEMANACVKALPGQILGGALVTKYGHAKGEIPGIKIFEAGHPVPDENTVEATRYIMDLAASLESGSNVIFLVSGGGSALFEMPEDGITLNDLEDITEKLLRCGADIVEINTIRKRLSKVKGGKFAKLCAPASIYTVALSDIVGDRAEFIASGPSCADPSTCREAMGVVNKYGLDIPENVRPLLTRETPKEIKNNQMHIIGSVRLLCDAAARIADKLGYHAKIMSTALCCQAYEAGMLIGSMAKNIKDEPAGQLPQALIFGGETTVKVRGNGKGGRNQEIALTAASFIEGAADILIFSIGSDGTDGPTDAAGGIVDGSTKQVLEEKGILISQILENNDSFSALKAAGGLIITGPTGTNVNDLTVALIK